ncbi:uncharacterized protein METZ01_LOCUS454574, partial [marine metagenome]
GRFSSGGAPPAVDLSVVTGDPTTADQSTESVGAFAGPATGDWDSMEFFPLKDADGKLAQVNLSGTSTVRLTILPGNVDMNYLAFVPYDQAEAIAFDLANTSPNISAVMISDGDGYIIKGLLTAPNGDPLEVQVKMMVADPELRFLANNYSPGKDLSLYLGATPEQLARVIHALETEVGIVLPPEDKDKVNSALSFVQIAGIGGGQGEDDSFEELEYDHRYDDIALDIISDGQMTAAHESDDFDAYIDSHPDFRS